MRKKNLKVLQVLPFSFPIIKNVLSCKAKGAVFVQNKSPCIQSLSLNQLDLIIASLRAYYCISESLLLRHLILQKDMSLIFSNGAYKPAADREHSRRCFKWYSAPNANGLAQLITTR